MASTAPSLLGRLWSSGLDYALPSRCPGCGAIVDGDHRFCALCWQALEFLGLQACARCAMRLPHDPGGPDALCVACHADPPAYDRAMAAVAYGDIARTVALRLKYAGRSGVAQVMAARMARLVQRAPTGALIVAVPLHRWRLWSRGYNQALLIARALAERSGDACLPDAIVRTQATPVLRGLGRKALAATVCGAFAVPVQRKAGIKGRTILLVDDIFATAEACAKALHKAGAAEVWLVCWARVVRDDDGARR